MPKGLDGAFETGWETERTTQAETRYGCFLPDLTGLARGLSAADLPPHYIRCRRARGKFRVAHGEPKRSAAVCLDQLKPGKDAAMPAKSKAQQKAAGAALAAKRGEQKVSELKGASKSMYQSMSEEQLEEFASTKRKGKPEHVK